MRSVVVGTAGHIDHGKSALVRALTGTDPDRLKEEKARGITIDLGFAHLQLGDVSLAFVDVPGHERFVKNMLAGAGGIDAVILVIAADESVMPQTREHFQICRLLRVPVGVIALTKCDVADADMRELARLEARELVAGSFLEGQPILEVSSVTGAGLDAMKRALADLAAHAPARRADYPLRLPIDRAFSVKGFGTVVTGTLTAGTLAVEQEVEILPGGRAAKIRGLQVHGAPARRAAAGQRVAVNLGGIDVESVGRGATLTTGGIFEPGDRFDAAVDLLDGVRPLKHGARVRFHHGTTELLGRVSLAGSRGGHAPAVELAPGGSAFVRVRLERPAVLTRGDRFILRAYSPSVTIGGGVVLDPAPPRGALRSEASLARFAELDSGASGDFSRPLVQFVKDSGAAGLPIAALPGRAGVSAREAERASDGLVAAGTLARAGDRLVLPAVLEELAARVMRAVEAHHAAEPLSDGLPREEARERVFRRASTAVFEHVLARLLGAGRLEGRERLALAGRGLALSPEEAAAREAIERAYREAGLAPPDAAALASAAGLAPELAERVSQWLVRRKTLVRLGGLLFHAEALDRLKTEVRAMKADAQARVDVAGFKARYGISRKFAIPLLEYLDRERVTRRVGESRVVI